MPIRTSRRHAVIALLAAAALAGPALAVEPGEMLSDPALEARARTISAELRCLVCQNQSIDDSNAPLAKDLRLLVRERIAKGESDKAVMDYIVARYGDFVLLKPPINSHTLLLWLTPVLCLLGLGAFLYGQARRPAATGAPVADTPALSADEERRLADLLKAPEAPESLG